MKIIPCVQGSPEWAAARLGVVTASEIDALVSPEGKVRTGEGPRSYLYKKLCERVLGFANSGGSWSTEQGQVLEMEAAPWYNFTYNAKIQHVGFITTDDGRCGASPDGLLGEDGGIEIKSYQPENALRVFMEGVVPKEHTVQIQTALFVTQRKWWRFLSYSRQWPHLLLTVEPDPKLQATIKAALEIFYEAFDAALARINSVRELENAAKLKAYEAAGDRSR